MDEQQQNSEELEKQTGAPPGIPDDLSTPAQNAGEPQMPEMNFIQNTANQPAESPDMNEADAEALMLKMMEENAAEKAPNPAPIVEKPSFEQLRPDGKHESKNIDMLLDVTLPVSIELGRTALKIEDILNLGPGSVVELDKLAGEPVDILINDKILAKGEVVVVDENFGVRITSMISPQDRIRSLK
ncbi:MAG: flagellar motor switch protein FliN [candidate division Zixibacteria bacterium]|nr:flagellar motor switch protein FliN [candidate division Zixibacteria bacterium]